MYILLLSEISECYRPATDSTLNEQVRMQLTVDRFLFLMCQSLTMWESGVHYAPDTGRLNLKSILTLVITIYYKAARPLKCTMSKWSKTLCELSVKSAQPANAGQTTQPWDAAQLVRSWARNWISTLTTLSFCRGVMWCRCTWRHPTMRISRDSPFSRLRRTTIAKPVPPLKVPLM